MASRLWLVFALLALSSGARASSDDDLVWLRSEEGRATAVRVLRDHYQDLLDTIGSLRLTGIDKDDPTKPAVCNVSFSSRTAADYPAGWFSDGVPVRRRQPSVFSELQRQVSGGLIACERRMRFTTRSIEELESAFDSYADRVSRTTYCDADAKCVATRWRTPAGSTVTLVTSDATDAALAIATLRFIPALRNQIEGEIGQSLHELGAAHPDYARWRSDPRHLFPRPRPDEAPLEPLCVEHSCRIAEEHGLILAAPSKLSDEDYAAAVAALRAHYQALWETMGSMKLVGLDKSEPARPYVCDLSVSSGAPADYPPGAFVDGLPRRPAQRLAYQRLQDGLGARFNDCAQRMYMTSGTWLDAWAAFDAYARRTRDDAVCSRDEECSLEEPDPGPPAPHPVRFISSNRIDQTVVGQVEGQLLFFLGAVRIQVVDAIKDLGSKHPDYAAYQAAPDKFLAGWRASPQPPVACRRSVCAVSR